MWVHAIMRIKNFRNDSAFYIHHVEPPKFIYTAVKDHFITRRIPVCVAHRTFIKSELTLFICCEVF